MILGLATANENGNGRARLQSCGPPRRSARNLARVSAFCEPLEPVPNVTNAPRRGRGELLQPPAGVHIVILLLSGGSLRSPPANHPSPRWGGIRTTEVVPSRIFIGATEA